MRPGKPCECGRPLSGRSAARGCAECGRIELERVTRFKRRLLRALRREGDWVDAFSLAVILDVSEHDRESVSQQLYRLVEAGQVESRQLVGTPGHAYRAV